MSRPNAHVGGVVEVQGDRGPASQAESGPTYATLRLDTGDTARIPMGDPRATAWVSVLSDLRSAEVPVYVEIDPESRVLTEVLVPLRVTVVGLEASDDGVVVELEISQARHYLRRVNPDYEELLALLERARSSGEPVLVTETVDGASIIDVRALPKGLPAPPSPERDRDLGPTAESRVSAATARQMFSLANGRTCCSAGPSAPCIPFTYPDDGCWGRAHEMSRLMIASGVRPEKIWIYGNLRVRTANNPACEVQWGWHVAPVLRVDTASGPQVHVIDPSLFPSSTPQATWVGAQGDPHARTVITSAEVFHRRVDGTITLDPTYAETNRVLATYRSLLQLRSVAEGPPPYPQCLTRPPGVQWFGTLEPGATRRWFTFGWPASWHVVWSIMPLSICPGAPQLSWSVAVERADSRNATYWLSVRNLTQRTVRFEGRYDVLSR